MCIDHAGERRYAATSVGLTAAHTYAVARRAARGVPLNEFDRKTLDAMSDLLRTAEAALADPLTGVRATPEAMLLIDVAGRLPLGDNGPLAGFKSRSEELTSVIDKQDVAAAQRFVPFASSLARQAHREAGSNECTVLS